MRAKCILSLFISILSFFATTAQQPVNEIDRLCSKYKDGESITIYSTLSEIAASISISKNVDGKPEAIKIYGETTDIDAISEIVYNLIQKKKKQGFVHDSGDVIGAITRWDGGGLATGKDYIKEKLNFGPFSHTERAHFELVDSSTHSIHRSEWETIYKKGSLYFYVSIVREKCEPFQCATQFSLGVPKLHKYNYCRFSLTNGDNSRKGGANAQPLDF